MNTDKLNQIEGYAGLDRWCDNNFIDQSDTVVLECYPAEETEQKLLEMQEEIERLKAEKDEIESDLIDLKSQGHYYAVTYMGKLQHVSISEENANKYSDKFGGVYSVDSVDMAVAFNTTRG